MGGLSVPLLSLAIPPDEAAGIMLPILCAMDAIGLRRFAGSFNWPNLRIILPGAIAGIALGTLCFGLLNKGWLLLLVGAIGVGFPLLNWSGLARRQKPAGVSVAKGGFWSALSGFTSFRRSARPPAGCASPPFPCAASRSRRTGSEQPRIPSPPCAAPASQLLSPTVSACSICPPRVCSCSRSAIAASASEVRAFSFANSTLSSFE